MKPRKPRPVHSKIRPVNCGGNAIVRRCGVHPVMIEMLFHIFFKKIDTFCEMYHTFLARLKTTRRKTMITEIQSRTFEGSLRKKNAEEAC